MNHKALPAPEIVSATPLSTGSDNKNSQSESLPNKSDVQCGICLENITIQGVLPCCDHSCKFCLHIFLPFPSPNHFLLKKDY
jgi:hypothetical protein